MWEKKNGFLGLQQISSQQVEDGSDQKRMISLKSNKTVLRTRQFQTASFCDLFLQNPMVSLIL